MKRKSIQNFLQFGILFDSNMKQYKQEFIEFMVNSNVLIFGEFTTKSGRKTPYFVNTGNYTTGEQMAKLGEYYAQTVHEQFGTSFNVLFGPAYKGIPLVITTAIALKKLFNHDVEICFNRKEIKDHGEQGVLIGKKLVEGDKVVIIEDVTTAGTSIRETVPLLFNQAQIDLQGLVVSVDRMEKGQTPKGALKELAEEFEITTTSIVDLDDIVHHLTTTPIKGKIVLNSTLLALMKDYRQKYGCL